MRQTTINSDGHPCSEEARENYDKGDQQPHPVPPLGGATTGLLHGQWRGGEKIHNNQS